MQLTVIISKVRIQTSLTDENNNVQVAYKIVCSHFCLPHAFARDIKHSVRQQVKKRNYDY